MALLVNSVGDNAFQPGITAETYIPDQLIAGDFKIVTDDNAMLASGQNLLRGTVLGQKNIAVTGSAGGVQASGTLTFAAQPAVADTLTFNGTVVTFIAFDTEPVGNQVALGQTVQQTIENLLAFLAASTDAQIVKFVFSAVALVVTATAALGGTAGNSLTLATSSANVTLSAGTLAGGAANTGTGTIGSLATGAQAKVGNYALACVQSTTGTPASSVQAADGNVGTGTVGARTITQLAQLGAYRLVLTATGATAAFDLFYPDGQLVGAGNVASVFTGGGLSFTLANAGTMTAGDTWNIIVTDTGYAYFSVTAPNGEALPNATVGVAYVGQIDFTLTQGGTKFAVADTFQVAVGLGSGLYTLCQASATDGSQVPVGILVDNCNATSGNAICGVYQTGEFNGDRIWFDPSWNLSTLTAALRKSSIFLKSFITATDPSNDQSL